MSRAAVSLSRQSVAVPLPPLYSGQAGSQAMLPAAATTGSLPLVTINLGGCPLSRLPNRIAPAVAEEVSARLTRRCLRTARVTSTSIQPLAARAFPAVPRSRGAFAKSIFRSFQEPLTVATRIPRPRAFVT